MTYSLTIVRVMEWIIYQLLSEATQSNWLFEKLFVLFCFRFEEEEKKYTPYVTL